MPSRRNTGRTNSFFIAFLASILLVIALGAWLLVGQRKTNSSGKPPLLMYCAVAVKTPVEAIAKDYERQTGTRIELQFGASQTLLTNATLSHQGDLYLPADDSYIAIAREKGLISDETPLAIQRLVLVVAKGNPARVLSLDDLKRPGIKLAQANPDAAASGKVTRDVLRRSGQWDAIAAHTTVFTATVVEAANDVTLGSADAAFIWDALASQSPQLEIIPLPVLANAESKVVVAVLKTSAYPEEAMQFARYLASVESGQPAFRQAGFSVGTQP